MPAYVADLHNHTPHLMTDYRGSVDTSADDVVRAASDAGIDILGVTDHYCSEYALEVRDAADALAEETGFPMLVLGGAELRLQVDSDEVHVVALFEPETASAMLSEVLGEFGVVCPVDSDHELPGLVGRADPIEVAKAIRERGGIAIAAHVDHQFGDYKLTDSSYFMEIVYSGCFDAIEVTNESTAEWLHQMSTPAVIASSDAHATEEMGRRRTLVAMRALSHAELRGALERGSSVPMFEGTHAGAMASAG